MSRFPYKKAEMENIPCNFCNSSDFYILSKKDRNNLNVQTVICKNCGLIFINPRMTKEWYKKYYEEEYRDQMARYKGLDRAEIYTNDYLFKKALGRGKKMANLLKPYFKKGFVIEVGSSTGGILKGFKDIFNVEVLGIEPAPGEAEYANSHGIKTVCSMFENLDKEIPIAETILCFRSINHILDFKKFLIWANEHLKTDGRLILEVMNFLEVFNYYKYLPRAIQIDHVFMFTPLTLKHFVNSLGFETIFQDTDKKGQHIYLVARKIGRYDSNFKKLADSFHIYKETIKEIKTIKNSFSYYSLKYGLKKKLYIIFYKSKRFIKRIINL